MTTVVNLKYDEYDVYIGRGSILGNPFTVKQYGRKKAIQKYKEYLLAKINSNEISKEYLRSLKDKKLGCYCKPLDCHGDIIKEVVDSL